MSIMYATIGDRKAALESERVDRRANELRYTIRAKGLEHVAIDGILAAMHLGEAPSSCGDYDGDIASGYADARRQAEGFYRRFPGSVTARTVIHAVSQILEDVAAMDAPEPDPWAKESAAIKAGLASIRPDVSPAGRPDGLDATERAIVLDAIESAGDIYREAFGIPDSAHGWGRYNDVRRDAGRAAIRHLMALRPRTMTRVRRPPFGAALPQKGPERQELAESGSTLGHHG